MLKINKNKEKKADSKTQEEINSTIMGFQMNNTTALKDEEEGQIGMTYGPYIDIHP